MQKKAESLTQRLRSPSSALRHVAWRNGFLVGVDVKSDSKFRCIIKFKEDSQDTRKPYTRTDIQVDATVTLGTVYAHDNKPITLTYLQKVIGRLTNGARIWYNENLGVGKMMYDISRQ